MSRVPFYVLSIGLAPLCENMPSGKANKPGDVVRARNGKTIQVREGTTERAVCYHPAAACHGLGPQGTLGQGAAFSAENLSCKVPLVLMKIFEYFFPTVLYLPLIVLYIQITNIWPGLQSMTHQ